MVILTCPFLYSQSIGFSIGYGAVNMNSVNKYMEESKNAFSGIGIYSEPDEVKSGLFLEGSLKYGIGNANVGILYDYISSSGSYRFNIPEASYQENFDVSTGELLGMLEFLFGNDSSMVKPFLKAAAGIGFASAEYNLDFQYYQDPAYNLTAYHPLSGKDFAGRVEGGLQFFIRSALIIELAVGYRIADSGDLKGDQTVNGSIFSNVSLLDNDQAPVKFNYSGFLLRAGINFRF